MSEAATGGVRICFCAPEAVPFAKTGGLADVAGALPRALAEAGCDIRVVLPAYQSIDRKRFAFRPIGAAEVLCGAETGQVRFLEGHLPRSTVPVYLVEHAPSFNRPGLYGEAGVDYADNLERFAVFNRGVLALLRHLRWAPQIVHCHDWQTSLLPVWLAVEPRDPVLAGASTLLTVHNLAYQGLFPRDRLPATGLPASLFTPAGIEFYGRINLLKGGLVFADLLNTVSEQYAREIQTEEFGCGLEGVLRERAGRLIGILNGVDYAAWDPAGDRQIPARYTADDLGGKQACKADLQRVLGFAVDAEVPLCGMITRLADQKGLDLVASAFAGMLRLGVQFVLLGTGDQKYHTLFERLHAQYPDRVGITLGFDDGLAHRIEAGADIFLMPSRYEPSGLNQLYSLRYGTVPVVRRTGGLADTIVDATPEALRSGEANGFVFSEYSPAAFREAVARAVRTFADRQTWRRLQQTGMGQDFSWGRSAGRYLDAYRRLIAARGHVGTRA